LIRLDAGFGMKGDFLYWSLARALDWLVWRGELLNRENLPDENPAIFISNHAATLGPIAVMSSLPVRVYPWVVSDMMEWDKAAEYLRRDFVEKQLHVPPPYDLTLAALTSKISVPLFHYWECIPVWKGSALPETYRLSIEALVQGKNLLIFPEDPKQEMNELFMMTPFYKGFTRLGEMYYERTKRILRFFPLAVHPAARKIKAGKPVSYNPYNDPVRERIRIKNRLESAVHELYLSLVLESLPFIPLTP
jgi:hypothetical protein